jgi:hypothetical protein
MRWHTNPGRVCGFIYLLLGFAVVRLQYIPTLFVGRNATLTSNSIAAHEWVFRLGMVSDLLAATASIFLVVALYQLLKHINPIYAVLMVILGGPMPAAVYFCNVLNDVAALLCARPADFLAVFDKPQRDAMMMLFLRLHDYGVFANEIFWGLWLVPFGLLIYHSGFMPRILAVALFIAAAGYLTFSLTGILVPQYVGTVATFATPAILGEGVVLLWLVIMGARPQRLAVTA